MHFLAKTQCGKIFPKSQQKNEANNVLSCQIDLLFFFIFKHNNFTFRCLPFSSEFSRGLAQGADILRECSPSPTCHMTCVTFHMSHVTCPHLFYSSSFLYRVVKLVHGGSYPQGLPRLVYFFKILHTGDTNSLDQYGKKQQYRKNQKNNFFLLL